MGSPNFHRILTDSPSGKDYLSQLSISDEQYRILRKSRDLARDAIIDGFKNWKSVIKPHELLSASSTSKDLNIKIPKFKMQGSFAYKTLNSGSHVPPQEIDLDDGMFLPVSYEEMSGNPEVISAGIFKIVEKSLEPLCLEKGWRLKPKDTCVRIILNQGTHAHIDIALYAIEEKQYFQLRKSMAQDTNNQFITDESHFIDNLYKSLPSDFIMLAHREKGWIQSDPRKLEDWFLDAVNEFGGQLRNLCRYIKGWRDYKWTDCSLSSISLMKIVIDALRLENAELESKRDDLALKYVVSRLPELINARIENPVIDGMYLDEGWSDADRANFYSEAIQLRALINQAFSTSSASDTILVLKQALGDKIPSEPDLIQIPESTLPDSAPLVTAAIATSNSNAQTPNPDSPVIKSHGGRYA